MPRFLLNISGIAFGVLAFAAPLYATPLPRATSLPSMPFLDSQRLPPPVSIPKRKPFALQSVLPVPEKIDAPRPQSAVVIPPNGKELSWPVVGKISSPYGKRGSQMHTGVDIPVPLGTPVQAAREGTVEQAGTISGYGKTVILNHGNGVKTLYAHCASLSVEEGESIARGQVIAYAGRTGRATTSHVHFSVIVAGNFLDPGLVLKEPPPRLAKR